MEVLARNVAVEGPVCAASRAGSSCWPRRDNIPEGGTKGTFLSLHCPAGAHLPVPGENQPYCQKLAMATGCHAAGRQTGHRSHFQLGMWSTLVELFRGVYGWVREVGERTEVSRVELCSFSQSRQSIGTILLPAVEPFTAAQSMSCAISDCDALPLCVLP